MTFRLISRETSLSPVRHEAAISPAHAAPSIGGNRTLHSQVRSWQCCVPWLLFPLITTPICLSRGTWGQMIISSWLCERWASCFWFTPGQDSFCLSEHQPSNHPFILGNATSTDGRSYFRVTQPTAWPPSVQWTSCKREGQTTVPLHFPHSCSK